MKEKEYSVPIAVQCRGRIRYVLSTEGPDQKDHLLKRNGRLVVANSMRALRSMLKLQSHPNVAWKWKQRVNLDEFFRITANLMDGRASSQKTCEVILSGWNFLEDLARTVNAPPTLRIYKKGTISKMYDKVFWGNNLPAVTPEGKEYRPIWTRLEIRKFKPALRELTIFLRGKAPEVIG